MSTRNTIQRQIVLDAVRTLHSKHPTADEIYQHILREHPGLGRATVYRNLSILSENGRIQKLEMPIPPDRFDDALRQHYHMQCRICREICDANIEYMTELEHKIEDSEGFKVEGHDIIFKGICKKCSNNNFIMEDTNNANT